MADATVRTWFERVRAWHDQALAAGWLGPDAAERLAGLEQGSPADLFADATLRPLVVALFGGTGVGKSSLLNRLAAEPIARVGVERPTSREITVYVHEAAPLSDIPPHLPLAQTVVRRHRSPAHRNVLFLDMPDIDSTVEDNRRLALAWLPFVDLVLYVVSPERYRDDAGWRVLLERGARCGWIFVMNRWDEGAAGQREDLAAILTAAGFENPLHLCTCCRPPPPAPPSGNGAAGDIRRTDLPPLPSPDEFERIDAEIDALLAEHGERELARLGVRARLGDLRDALRAAAADLPDEQRLAAARHAVEQRWQSSSAAICDGMEWPLASLAGRIATRDAALLPTARRLVGRVTRAALAEAAGGGAAADVVARAAGRGDATEPRAAADESRAAAIAPRATQGDPADPQRWLASLDTQVWDDWADEQVAAYLDAAEVALHTGGARSSAVRDRLERAAAGAAESVRSLAPARVRTALSRAGGAWRRAARRVTGFLMAFLPLLALAWIGSVVVWRFYHAAIHDGRFLGGDFAINAALLVLVAWAAPFALDRLLRPSLERTVVAALRQALRDGLSQTADQLRAALDALAAQVASLRDQAAELDAELSRALSGAAAPTSPRVARLVARVLNAVPPRVSNLKSDL